MSSKRVGAGRGRCNFCLHPIDRNLVMTIHSCIGVGDYILSLCVLACASKTGGRSGLLLLKGRVKHENIGTNKSCYNSFICCFDKYKNPLPIFKYKVCVVNLCSLLVSLDSLMVC